MLSSAVLIVIAGVHAFFKMSKQMAPVSDDTFGCQIGVTKRTAGGSNGYAAGSATVSFHTPPSYGVPSGPASSAANDRRLSAAGTARTPDDAQSLPSSSRASRASRADSAPAPSALPPGARE
jgi:hypothetical protein